VLEQAGAIEIAVADDPAEGELLLAGRRQVLTAFEKLGTTMIDDVCVPRNRLAELVERVEQVSKGCGLTIGIVGHAGDGNFHPTVVFDGQDPDQVARAKQAFDDIMGISLELGGTITGEHGVGVLKMALLERELGDLSLRVHRDLKRALDPLGILNPGKVFALDVG
jgi:glycolate oxidase